MTIFTPNTVIRSTEVNANFEDSIDITKQLNPYKFCAYRSSAQNSANSTIAVQLNAVAFDTNSNFNTSTYKYIVPVSGYYYISGTVGAGAGNVTVYQSKIYNNGSQIKSGSLINLSTSYQYSVVHGLFELEADDEVQLYIYASGVVPIGIGVGITTLEGFLVST